MTTRRPVFGWVIAGTLVGAVAGYWLAQARPKYEYNHVSSREAALKTADRLIPLVGVCSVFGAGLGCYAERWLADRVGLRRALTILLLSVFILAAMFDNVVTVFHLIRTRGASVR